MFQQEQEGEGNVQRRWEEGEDFALDLGEGVSEATVEKSQIGRECKVGQRGYVQSCMGLVWQA